MERNERHTLEQRLYGKETVSGRTRISSLVWLTYLAMQQLNVLCSNLDPRLRYTEASQQSVICTQRVTQQTYMNIHNPTNSALWMYNLKVPLSCITQTLTFRNSFRKHDYALLYSLIKDNTRAEILFPIFLAFFGLFSFWKTKQTWA